MYFKQNKQTACISIHSLESMLELQEAMNCKIHPQWRHQNFPWYRAIWVECAELLDHYGWKWWKKQSPDSVQISLELVDIWHFGLSITLQQEENLQKCAQFLLQQFVETEYGLAFERSLEALAAHALSEERFDVEQFYALMKTAGLSFDQLYQHYLGKNVLNMFRQDHGYQRGEYVKVWANQEDNSHLAEIFQTLDLQAPGVEKELYTRLATRYRDLVTDLLL